jgi:UDP-N-acetylmuramoyl-tripeptide--D-alanyl-D-alanine ligase
MQTLANRVRRAWGRRVIGVTGSAGKTTTKEAVATVLAAQFNVLKSAGNLNNHFGVPLQLLRLEPEHEVAVIEMGMNHAGEISLLAKIAEPDWAVVSNVAAVHLEFFPEGIAGIAKAKYELVQALPEDGVAILNADDRYVAAFARGMGERAVLYGCGPDAQVRAENVVERGLYGTDFDLAIGKPGQYGRDWPVVLRLPGRHNVMNALAAVAVGLRSGLDRMTMVGALESMRPGEKRGNLIEWRGTEIVNDTYNSNPAALNSMVQALKKTEGTRRIVIAGEMLELGPDAAALHTDCGRNMAGLDYVVGVRGHARALVEGATEAGVQAVYVDTPAEAGAWMAANLRPGDAVLLKASRGVRLENALAVLEG